MRKVIIVLLGVFFLLALPTYVMAQTATTGVVSGTVTDPTGAVIPGAEVTLLDTATNIARTMHTNEAGQYVFASVTPGIYKLTVTMAGFRQAVLTDLKVEVAKSHLANFTLEVGAVAEVVEVTAGAGVALQTTDATIGSTLVGEALLRLPTTNRSAAALLLLQPMVAPGRGVDYSYGGQVAGARSDQSVFLVDGGDATSDIDGTLNYAAGSGGEPLPVIPVPAESIEEFRVSTTNPNATFGSAAGGQISFVTKRGTNSLHGTAYWYHQNDNLNANTWSYNRTGIEKPELKDNRYGFAVGGPLAKDKLFLFGHYEGRRYPRTSNVNRLVPTDTLRQGILRFKDALGNIVSYPLGTSTMCGTYDPILGRGTLPCDPRGLGISPVVTALWKLLPTGNDPFQGDTLNTTGFRGPADSSIIADFAVARLDYNITEKWNFFTSFRFYRHEEPDLSQVDIGGLTAGHQLGQAAPAAAAPMQPRYLVAGITGQITSRLTNEFRYTWMRNWWEWRRTAPFPQVPGTAAALELAGEPGLVDEPINIDTQNARGRSWSAKDTHIADNATWVKGSHTVQFGGSFRNWDIYHPRDDKVFGSLTSLIYWLDSYRGLAVPADNQPPTCSATIKTNCLASGDVSTWNSLYAAALGIVDRAGVLVAFDKQFNPLPFGTQLKVNMDINAVELYAQDTWRLRPSFTLSYGVNYGVQLPPVEENGLSTLMVYKDTEALVYFDQYMARKRDAALRGQTYDPQFAWATLARTGRKYVFNPDWDNFGPRIAASWNPSFTGGFLGRLFGERKTVLRGGYSLVYDRVTSVNTVMGSPITVGFGVTISCLAPRWDTGTCAGSSDPTNAFRIGVDGSTSPFPVISKGTDPVQVPAPLGETMASQQDLDFELGMHHGLDFTIQRELPGNLLLEVGYVGRLGRNLQVRTDLNSVPWFFLDPTSGQTLAQAFDLVATELRAGVSYKNVTKQPWFENLLAAGCAVTTGCPALGPTRFLASKQKSYFVNGELSGLAMFAPGIVPTGNFPIVNMQVERNRIVTDGARSNYHAGFIALRKRMSHGLTFELNYTLSKSLGVYSLNQQSSNTVVSGFDFDLDYGPLRWDRRHVFNSHWFYELPFGRGRRFAAGNWLDKLMGGWWTAGIFTANSGVPLCVQQGGRAWGGGHYNLVTCAVPINKPNFGNEPHYGPTGSAVYGTASDVNLFADPEAVFKNFRQVLLSQDGRSGNANPMRGLARWNVDWSVGKKTAVTENVNLVFSLDFLNVFNHMEFDDPSGSSLRLTTKSSFGSLRYQFNRPRYIQFGFRVEF